MSNLPSSVQRAVRVYRHLLAAYPAGFRARFGGEMAATFQDTASEAYSRHGAVSVFTLLARSVPNVLRRANAEHRSILEKGGLLYAKNRTASWIVFLILSGGAIAATVLLLVTQHRQYGYDLFFFEGPATFSSTSAQAAYLSIAISAFSAYLLTRRLRYALASSAILLIALVLGILGQQSVLRILGNQDPSYFSNHAFLICSLLWLVPSVVGPLLVHEIAMKRFALLWGKLAH